MGEARRASLFVIIQLRTIGGSESLPEMDRGMIMAGSVIGTLFRVTTWGESHGKGVGAVVDGCPAGLPLCEEDIQEYLDRRRPGQNRFTTRRSESDTVQILSGVFE